MGVTGGIGYNQAGGLGVNLGASYMYQGEIIFPETNHSPVGDSHLGEESVDGDCGYFCLVEIAEAYGYSEKDLEDWLILSGNSRGDGITIIEMQRLLNLSNEFKSDFNAISPQNNIQTINDIITSFENDKRVIAGFEYIPEGRQNPKGHATTVRKVKIWESGKYKIYFNQTSPRRITPYTSSNLKNDFHNIWFVNAYRR